MELSYNQQKVLYEEMLNVNEENINGEFYVLSLEEMKMQALNI
ncbi:hypothetical protein [Cerasibacillus terrae]|nr:hypothetical protein [Cerasibacillus terrae]